MKKILVAIAAVILGAVAFVGTSGSAQAVTYPGGIDYGTPYVSHGALGNSHIRGGEWDITSKSFSATGDFATYASPSVKATAGSQGVTRWRITFTPAATSDLDAKIAADGLPAFGTALGGGFVQGAAVHLNGKVVVFIFAVGNKS